MGVAGCETLPLQRCAAHRLVLQQVEVLKNDRGETTEGGDVDSLLLCELHGIEHLPPSCFEPTQHLRNEAGIDVGTLDRGSCGAGDLHVFHELWRSTAPHIEISIRNVIETQFHRLATGCIEAR